MLNSSEASNVEKQAVLVAEFDPGGGPYKNMLRITRALVARGFTVHVFPCASEYPDLAELGKNNPKVHIYPRFARPYPKRKLAKVFHYLFETRNLAKWLRKDAAFQATNDLPVIFSITSPGRFLWRYRGPARAIYIFRSNPEGRAHKLLGPVVRWLLKPRAQVVGVSEATTNELVSAWNLNPKRLSLSVLRNSAGAEGLTPAQFNNPVKQILMVGRLHPHKSPLLWLEVAKRVLESCTEPVQFVWLGDGPLLQDAVGFARELDITDRVEFKGFNPKPYEEYQKSYIYLHIPSVEPMANAVIDAMCIGVTPIVSNVGGNTEIVRDGYDGLVVSLRDPSRIAQEVKKLLSQPELHKKLSENAKKTYAQRFSSSVWAREFDALVADRKGSRA